jgi:phospholipid-binding lipoprotein MlaA
MPRPSALLLIFVLLPMLAACAGRPMATSTPDRDTVADPLELVNRGALAVTYAADTLVVRPAAEIYSVLLPPELRGGIRNALGNLRSPAVLANNLLQGDLPAAGRTLARFAINSTAGIGGLFDVARSLGLSGEQQDFGRTLARWGVVEGPYLFVPLLGPSNPRDLLGFVVDSAANPLSWIGGTGWEAAARVHGALTVLDTREGLFEPGEAMRAMAEDPYAEIRMLYRLRRAAQIAGRDDAPMSAAGTGFPVGMGMDAAEMRSMMRR